MPNDQLDLTAGLVPKTATSTDASTSGAIDLSSGLVPKTAAGQAPLGDDLSEYGQQASGPQTDAGFDPATFEQRHPTITNIGRGLGDTVTDIGNSIKGIPSGIWHALPPVELVDTTKRALPVINAYEKVRQNGGSITDAIQAADTQARQQENIGNTIKKVADAFKANPTRETARALGDVAALATTIFAGGAAGAEGAAEGATGAEAGISAAPEVAGDLEGSTAPATHALDPATGSIEPVSQPGIVQQILKGRDVAQPGAQAVVRSGVQSSTETAGTADESIAGNIQNQPLLKGNQTVVDEPLNAIKANESAAYQKMDDVAGFDVKAEKAQLANDQYKLKQLGNTEADNAARENLTESISDSQTRITDAESKIQQAGIDPKAADVLHQQRMAGMDFKKALVKNTNADGSINVSGMLRDAKNLRFNKYGDRLQQFMGKDGADNFVRHLDQLDKLGAHAVKAQRIAKWIGGSIAGIGTAADIASHLLAK
jgi:hypothetical protein